MNLNRNEILKNNFRRTKRVRISVGLSIMLIVSFIHAFRMGSYLNGNLYLLYYSYVSDIIIPFGLYFLLCINQLYFRILHKWYVKAAIIIGLTTLLETLQLFGIYALGITFDPFDILAYVIGVGIAVIFDRFVFRKIFPNWNMTT